MGSIPIGCSGCGKHAKSFPFWQCSLPRPLILRNIKMSDDKKVIKTNIGDLILADNKDLEAEAKTGIDSFEKEDRSFDCKMCGKHFTPHEQQWIFYEFCNECFNEFDSQKMTGRFSHIFGGEKPDIYFESSSDWIAWKKSRQN